jgi:hypothetical protein
MMRHAATVLALLLVTAPALAQHGFGAREQWQPQVSDTDSRLRQSVEIEILGRAAVPALAMLSEATGVSLTVAPEHLTTVGERKLTIISKGLTLKTIMVQLSEALQECHWDIDESGAPPIYLLHRNASVEAMVEQQKAEIRAHRSAQYRAERAAARLSRVEAVRRALEMSPNELARLEETDLLLARAAQVPTTREMMGIFLSIPDEEMAQFVETGQLEYRGDDAPPEVQRLPQLLLELFRQYVAWVESWAATEQHPSGLSTEEMNADLEEKARRIEQSSDLTISFADDQSGISVRAGDFGAFPIIPARQDFFALPGSLGHFLLAHTGYDYATALDIIERREDQEAEGGNPHDWEDSLGAEPSDVRLHHPISLPQEGRVMALLEFQQVIAAQTGMSVVSDFFTHSGVLYRENLRAEMPLWHVLTYLALRGIEWEVAGDCLVFHERRWYNRIRQEVPEHLLFPLVRRYFAGDLTLDDMCAFVTALRRRHGTTLTPRLVPALPRELPGLHLLGPNLYAIEAYAVLDEEQRAAVRSPEGLKLADLPSAARDIILAGATAPESSRYWPPEDLEQAAFHLEDAEDRGEGDGDRVWATSVLYLEFPDGTKYEARFRFPRFPSDITYAPLVHAEAAD